MRDVTGDAMRQDRNTYLEAFDATEIFRMEEPDGKIGHAEIQIGDSRLMLADEFPSTRTPARQPPE